MFNRLLVRSIGIASALFIPNVLCSNKRQVYIWGNGYYQARPDAILQFQNFTPKKIQGLPQNLQKLAFSQYFEAGIDSEGQLYIWDRQDIDSNFDKEKKDNHRNNVRMLQKDVQCIKFTNGYIWTLTKNNKVYQFPVKKLFDKNNEVIGTEIGEKRQVNPLKNTIQLETGRDHVIALKDDGYVYAMGDDTYGQCGQADVDRSTGPPFTQKRIKYPTKVKNLERVTRIACGSEHNLALDEGGNLFGWGSNSNLQLSHQDQFSRMSSPLLCSYNPIKILKNLDNARILNLKAGDEFSVLVTDNFTTSSCEVFTFGTNLKGQLGIDQIRHIRDVTKVQDLSNFVKKIDEKQIKVKIRQIECGKNHCIALLNIGYIMQWGDNEYGQMGNRKRSPAISPILLKQLNENNKKIIGVFAGNNASGVIVDDVK